IALQGFQVVIHDVTQLQWLEEELASITLKQPLTFWLKLDSGMGRLGILPADYANACKTLVGKPWCDGVVLMTHLANASVPESPLNAQQMASFNQAIDELTALPHLISTGSSAALLALANRADFVRPGIMLYGSSPF